jgi:hypothetical protein
MSWIKYRGELRTHPTVRRIARRLNANRATVLGALAMLWLDADEHTTDGTLPGLTLEDVDDITEVEGFGQALTDSGWLRVTDSGVEIVNFTEHNGASAKKRAENAKRNAAYKARKADSADRVTCADESGDALVTQSASPKEEKRREETTAAQLSPPTPPAGGEDEGGGLHGKILDRIAEICRVPRSQLSPNLANRIHRAASGCSLARDGPHGVEAIIGAALAVAAVWANEAALRPKAWQLRAYVESVIQNASESGCLPEVDDGKRQRRREHVDVDERRGVYRGGTVDEVTV